MHLDNFCYRCGGRLSFSWQRCDKCTNLEYTRRTSPKHIELQPDVRTERSFLTVKGILRSRKEMGSPVEKKLPFQKWDSKSNKKRLQKKNAKASRQRLSETDILNNDE